MNQHHITIWKSWRVFHRHERPKIFGLLWDGRANKKIIFIHFSKPDQARLIYNTESGHEENIEEKTWHEKFQNEPLKITGQRQVDHLICYFQDSFWVVILSIAPPEKRPFQHWNRIFWGQWIPSHPGSPPKIFMVIYSWFCRYPKQMKKIWTIRKKIVILFLSWKIDLRFWIH